MLQLHHIRILTVYKFEKLVYLLIADLLVVLLIKRDYDN
jgi:hypothetical protein